VRQNNKSMGYAFVEFDDEKTAKEALALDNTEVEKRKVRVQLATNAMPHQTRSFLARPPPASAAPDAESLSGHNEDLTLFVSNLPYSCDKEDVIKALAAVRDAVRDVRLAMDAKEGGRCRGFGYIELADAESVAKALAISNPTVKGRPVNISSARDKHTKSGNKNTKAPATTTGEGEEKKPEARYQ
jgi:nucleolin